MTMKKFFKGIGIFFAILITVALSVMLYANYSNYAYDKDKTVEYLTENAEVKSRTWCAWYISLDANSLQRDVLPCL